MTSAIAIDWDYSALAAHYERRAPYHPGVIAWLLQQHAPRPPQRAVDLGAGTGRFTRALVDAGYPVDAVEPNAQMRAIGCPAVERARWHASCAESTELESTTFGLALFASSFNVVDTVVALDECARVLLPAGVLVVLFNHRDLSDPLQARIEAAIRQHVPEYSTGARREDPTPAINSHGEFTVSASVALPFVHRERGDRFVNGFRAHATLVRQAAAALPAVIDSIARLVPAHAMIDVPFHTRVWIAQRRQPCVR